MENAKGGQFIRNGLEGLGVDRAMRGPVLNKSVSFFAFFRPFFSSDRRRGKIIVKKSLYGGIIMAQCHYFL